MGVGGGGGGGVKSSSRGGPRYSYHKNTYCRNLNGTSPIAISVN